MDGPAVERLRLRYAWAVVAANLVGGIVVLCLLTFVLPSPSIRHGDTLRLISTILFVVGGLVAFPIAWAWSARKWRAPPGWGGKRRPGERDRAPALGFAFTP